MQRNRRSLLVLVTLLAHSAILVYPTAAQIGWLGDVREAQLRASQSQRLILVHFWSDRCDHCQTVERNVFSKSAVARAIQTNYVPVKIQVEQNHQLVNQLKVRGWPTDVILAADGREIYRGVSQQDANRFISQLDQVAALHRYLPTSGSQARQAPRQTSPTVAPQYKPHNQVNKTQLAPNTSRGQQFTSNQLYSPPNPTSDQTRGLNVPHETPAPLAAPASRPQRQSQTIVRSEPSATRQTQDPRSAPWKRNTPLAGNTVPTAFNTQPSPSFNTRPAALSAAAVNSSSPRTTQDQGPTPPLGLDGFCPVTLSQQHTWKPGNRRWGIIHRERLYLFSSEDAMKQFWLSPDQFSPMLSGFDVVHFFHNGQLAAGLRQHGAWWGQEMFLFSDEASLKQFWSNPSYYSRKVHGLRQARASQ